MPQLDNAKWERFAQMIVAGHIPARASEKAGYADADRQRAERRLEFPEVAARIAELRRDEANSITDLKVVIDKLIEAATEAMKLDSAAAYTAARFLLVEAANLKRELAAAASDNFPAQAHLPTLSEEAWLATFAPKLVAAA